MKLSGLDAEDEGSHKKEVKMGKNITTKISKTKKPKSWNASISLKGFAGEKFLSIAKRLGLEEKDAINLFFVSLLVLDIATEEGDSKIFIETDKQKIAINLRELVENVKNTNK